MKRTGAVLGCAKVNQSQCIHTKPERLEEVLRVAIDADVNLFKIKFDEKEYTVQVIGTSINGTPYISGGADRGQLEKAIKRMIRDTGADLFKVERGGRAFSVTVIGKSCSGADVFAKLEEERILPMTGTI